jgi:hypothetical protein
MSGWQRCECLKELGHWVVPFNQDSYVNRARRRSPLLRLHLNFYDEQVVSEFNRDLLAALVATRPQVAWLEWPFLLRSETLHEAATRLPDCVLVSFQDDNPFGTRPGELNRWQHFIDAIPSYDLHFLKRRADVAEFFSRGARRTELFRHGFYERLFRPLPEASIPQEMRQQVSFVGTPLDNRAEVITELLVRHRLPLRVFGGRWNRTLIYFRRRPCFRQPVLGEDYARVICGSKICLGFVSSSNRDEYTMRTFEIPACRGFLLAERTIAHQQLFTEGQEAEYFGSTEECADKIRFYLAHESARAQIAQQGFQRSHESDYSLRSSMARAVEQIESVLAWQ